jgi:hypothetical protein
MHFGSRRKQKPFQMSRKEKMRKITNKYKNVGNVKVRNSEYMEVSKRYNIESKQSKFISEFDIGKSVHHHTIQIN